MEIVVAVGGGVPGLTVIHNFYLRNEIVFTFARIIVFLGLTLPDSLPYCKTYFGQTNLYYACTRFMLSGVSTKKERKK
jgi:hypothetical protein